MLCFRLVHCRRLSRWPSGKASASRAEDPGFESRLRRDFSGSSHTSDSKIGTPVAIPWQAPGVIRSALGLVGPVSVYCDWMRYKVGSATSISVWQHVKLSEQIRPWDTLACCWDVKQPTNNPLSPPCPESHTNGPLKEAASHTSGPLQSHTSGPLQSHKTGPLQETGSHTHGPLQETGSHTSGPLQEIGSHTSGPLQKIDHTQVDYYETQD